MASVIIVGYARDFREGPFLVPSIHEQPPKEGPSSIGLKSYKAFQTTLYK